MATKAATKHEWMNEAQHERYLAFTLVANAMYDCMAEGNREGWKILKRVQTRMLEANNK